MIICMMKIKIKRDVLAKFEPIDDKCGYIEIVYTERNYIDDEKNPGSYKEYENGELNDIKIKVPINQNMIDTFYYDDLN